MSASRGVRMRTLRLILSLCFSCFCYRESWWGYGTLDEQIEIYWKYTDQEKKKNLYLEIRLITKQRVHQYCFLPCDRQLFGYFFFSLTLERFDFLVLHQRRDFPSTFRGVHGHTAYTLTMGINRQWRLSKDFVTELNYVNRIDTNQPELQVSDL